MDQQASPEQPSPATGRAAVTRALNGEVEYDALGAAEQAVVRRVWAARIDDRLQRLDLVAGFEREGRPYATLDPDGAVVIHDPQNP